MTFRIVWQAYQGVTVPIYQTHQECRRHTGGVEIICLLLLQYSFYKIGKGSYCLMSISQDHFCAPCQQSTFGLLPEVTLLVEDDREYDPLNDSKGKNLPTSSSSR